MNKRSVNISSLVILLSLLSFLFEMCLYYFIPQHLITVAVAAIISLGLAHFFLESSLNYDYCFLNIVTFKSCLLVSGINSYPGSARAF